jgi:hypothetical protein
MNLKFYGTSSGQRVHLLLKVGLQQSGDNTNFANLTFSSCTLSSKRCLDLSALSYSKHYFLSTKTPYHVHVTTF